ncbi:MAG: cbb3-type cytochrome c oxidase subunit I [Aggregatilineales bacterium]
MQIAQPLNTDQKQKNTLQFPAFSMLAGERALIGAHLLVAFAALSIGIFLGPFQTFRRAPAMQMEIPIFSYYYQALTLHGILNALVFTTFFIMGISYFVTQRSLERPLRSIPAAWLSFVMMAVGLVLTGGAVLAGEATVLYTFYAPMVAHPIFYIGLVLVVVGSWVGAGNVFLTYFDWRRDHPGERVPLAVFALVCNFVMWCTASLGVAVEILFMLLPLSLGLIDTTDVQVSRIFFWFFGHPLVYFWLLPAYVSWYTMLPIQLGVRLFSDSMARVAFLMLMIFSIPVGVHHLYVDPGISESAKIMHGMLTFVVAIPSFLTAFNVAATIERAGRKRGGKGLFGWIIKQPWGNPVVAAQYGGMWLFIFGGITGVMNASFNMNVALHNTTWIVGHFHITVGGAVFMTYMGITYWLLPIIRGRKLWTKNVALAQVYLWFFGMLIFSGSMGRAGIEGAVRRSDIGAAGAYVPAGAVDWLNLTAVAGGLLLLSSICLYLVLIGTLLISKEPLTEEAPITTKAPIITKASQREPIPAILENWRLWVTVVILSNVIMWGPVLVNALDITLGFWAVGDPGAAR